jgi:hypothetical protein
MPDFWKNRKPAFRARAGMASTIIAIQKTGSRSKE